MKNYKRKKKPKHLIVATENNTSFLWKIVNTPTGRIKLVTIASVRMTSAALGRTIEEYSSLKAADHLYVAKKKDIDRMNTWLHGHKPK